MPEDFKGDRSILPFLLATAPVGVYAWTRRGILSGATGDPIASVVGGRSAAWAAAMSQWSPNLSQIDRALHAPILEAFQRRVGKTTALGSITTLGGVEEATRGFPALRSILRQSIEEFRGIKPGQIGGSISSTGLIKGIPITTAHTGAVTNIDAVSSALARNDLGLSKAQRVALRQHLQELGQVAKDMMEKVPTFEIQTAGDRAISEMLINVHRTGGPVTMRVPLPSATGAITTATGTQYYARRVLGNIPKFLATGQAEEQYASEYAIQRLKDLISKKQGAIRQSDINELQREVRKQLIYMGDERGVLASGTAGATYAQQLYVPEFGATEAQRLKALNLLAERGMGAGLTPDALSKGVMWTKQGAAALPYGAATPQHYTQAMTKGQVVGGVGARANLFQVSPRAVEMAGRQLGMQAIVPQQDVIMMSKSMRGRMRAPISRPVTIDPTMNASKRIEKLQTLLRDNETARSLLRGGATVEEAMYGYMSEMMATGQVERYREMAGLNIVKEGEFLGFTESGPVFAKTYGTKTRITDIKTVGESTSLMLASEYDPQKVFSTGGIKHSLEYADPGAIRRLGIRAKALEILGRRTAATLDPSNPVDALRLARAEAKAARLYGSSVGLVVEGKGWAPWEKWRGAAKNVGRFNSMIEDKWTSKFGELPTKYWQTENLMERRKILIREARSRGINWFQEFSPIALSTREEMLRPGPAAEMLGIGRPGTFTDDAFRIFKMFGWTDIADDIAKRVAQDAPLSNLLEQAAIATRGAGAGVPLEEIMGRPGGLMGLLGDAGARAKFIAEEGGIVQLPQTYKIAGKEITQIAVPEMGTGFTGYFTTPEGREIQKNLDRSLREALLASTVDVGATGRDLAATGPLTKYFDDLSTMATRFRDRAGGRVAGSRTFAIGRQLLPDVVTEAGVKIPTAAISRATFENWVAQNLKDGMIDRSTVKEYRRMFKAGRLPVAAIKHPARGPLSAGIFYLGEAPKGGRLGWSAERNFMYLSESLLKPFVADLDFDPLPVDMFSSRKAMNEATQALESGQVAKWMERHQFLREKVLGTDIKGPQKGGLAAWFGDKWDTWFLKERYARDAASKSKVGIFTSRLSWPFAAAMEHAGLNLEQKFDALFWAELMEEKTTLKARHDFNIMAGTAEELVEAFQSGRHGILQERTKDILGLRGSSQEAYFDDILARITSSWKNMSHETRADLEAKFAGRGAARAKTWMRLAAGDTIIATKAGARGSVGFAGDAIRTFGRLGEVMRSRKKELLIAGGAVALAGMLFSQPRDLTPESVASGKVSGGPEPNKPRLPMPRLEKGLYYNKGAAPGYRINLNLSKETDHRALAQQLSKIAGDKPINIHINDSRKKITKYDIEREMREDRMFGGSYARNDIFNSSRYQ